MSTSNYSQGGQAGQKKGQRRKSSAGSTSTSAAILSVGSSGARSNKKRQVTPLLSEEHPSSSQGRAEADPSEPLVRQSFFTKLTSTDGLKNATTTTNLNRPTAKSEPQKPVGNVPSSSSSSTETNTCLKETHPGQSPARASATLFVYGTECDKIQAKGSKLKDDLVRKQTKDERAEGRDDDKIKQKFDLGGESSENYNQEKGLNKDKEFKRRKEVKVKADEKKKTEEEEDENNQVVPSWPSRSDALAGAANAEFVQHKIYSLKDYSQVASPTVASVPSGPASSSSSAIPSGSRLLKSISQDRRSKGQDSKRLSECLYLSGAASQPGSSSSSSKQPNPSGPSHSGSVSFSMGQSHSGHALLPPNSRHVALIGESRIDRVRKLFVSPLSLRSNSGSKVSSGQHQASSGASTANPRLSFQSGPSMLNKPHYLMHAMYRTSAAHHSRRSPMRQKQGKSFRVYGCPLHMANNIYPITCFGRADIYKQQSVPYVLARLCNYIEENSSQLTHEGIFRVSGNARLMEKLRTLFDHLGDAPLESESVDVATSASMLKMYLRELPEPLIPTRMNYYFIALAKKYAPYLTKDNSTNYKFVSNPTSSSAGVADQQSTTENQALYERQRLAFSRDLTKLLRKLPIENYNLLKYLACFLYRISLKQRYNKMCAEALGIVFGPNIFRIRSESYKGLKEQELSNQIMASIIGNYKFIFDSELTDPLGNLVDVKEDFDVSGDSKLVHITGSVKGKKVTNQVDSSSHSDSVRSKSGKNNNLSTSTQSSSTATITPCAPVPSTSKETDKAAADRACCSDHRQDYLLDNNEKEQTRGDESNLREVRDGNEEDDEDEGEEDEDIGNGDESDEVSDEGESYTPSTGSGSYCSSMDSETLESTYDGVELDADGRHIDLDAHSNVSSSECASDTSYTPTSSHTDSNGAHDDGEESIYGNSSSFESSPTHDKLMKAGTGGTGLLKEARLIQASGASPSCVVCKRRESVQKDGHLSECTKLCDRPSKDKSNDCKLSPSKPLTIPPVEEITSENNAMNNNNSASNIDNNSVNDAQENVSKKSLPLDINQESSSSKDRNTSTSSNQQQGTSAPLPIRTSRRKRTDGSRRNPHSVPQSQAPSEANISAKNSDGSSNLASEDQKKSHVNISINPRLDNLAPGKGRHSAASTKQPHKFDFFRRRSSSASSLNRMKHKREQIAAAQRKNVKDETSTLLHRHRAEARTALSEKRRLHESRGQNSIRRSRGRGHVGRKGDVSTGVPGSSEHSQVKIAQAKSKDNSASKKNKDDTYYESVIVENVAPLNLSPTQLINEEPFLSCDLLSAQYLEELEYDKFFLLRSFNSDETLLRSVNYCTEFAQEPSVKARRRFSGHDFRDKVNLIQVCQPCDQIFEGYEEEALVAQQEGESSDLNQTVSTSTRRVESPFDTSFISLIENRSGETAFRRSELSIENLGPKEDPILIQMKAINQLVKILKRYLKYVAISGYNVAIESILALTSSEASSSTAYSDESSTCYVDYLAAKSLANHFEEVLENCHQTSKSLEPIVDVARIEYLNEILTVKISLFKQRYNDFKNIREHCLKNHPSCFKDVSPKDKTIEIDHFDESKQKIYGSLDTLHPNDRLTTEGGRSRKLSEPGSEMKSELENAQSSLSDNDNKNTSEKSTKLDKESVTATNTVESTTKPSKEQMQGSSESNKGNKTSTCTFGSLCPVEFVFNIEKQLASKRTLGGRAVKLCEMSSEQLQSEKLELQKNLLRYEHWFGRPVTRLEFSLVGHLYERYRAVKVIKLGRQHPS